MPFDPHNPFNFPSNWENFYEANSLSTGDDVELGNQNMADANDATCIWVNSHDNAALIGVNYETGHGAVGVYGRTDSATFGIGTAGCSPAGIGAYGISQSGLGVVGRAMGSEVVEPDALEELVPQVGVFGHATEGPGVRGHGGSNFRSPSPADERRPRAIGAVFSAGELQDGRIPGATGVHEVSVEPLAQAQLIPSQSDSLPSEGRLGDLYLALHGDLPARLFICTKISGTTPMWQEIVMGADMLPSGSLI
jgi:hypothetical protein